MTRQQATTATDSDNADLLYGVPAIALFLGMREPQVRGRIERKQMPTFKIGGTICARRSTIKAWLASMEAGQQPPEPPHADA